MQAIGATERPNYNTERYTDTDAKHALKGSRMIYVPEGSSFKAAKIYDGHRLRYGNQIVGPAVIETVTTAVLVSDSFDCLVDRHRSLVLYRKGRDDLVRNCIEREQVPA